MSGALGAVGPVAIDHVASAVPRREGVRSVRKQKMEEDHVYHQAKKGKHAQIFVAQVHYKC